MDLEIGFENLNLEIDILELRLKRISGADGSVLGIKEARALWSAIVR